MYRSSVSSKHLPTDHLSIEMETAYNHNHINEKSSGNRDVGEAGKMRMMLGLGILTGIICVTSSFYAVYFFNLEKYFK